MQEWLPLVLFAMVAIVVLYRLIIGGGIGNTSRSPSGGPHGSIYDGSSGTTGSDCGSSGGGTSSGGGDGGSCGGSGGS
jgi:hypothetical protein